MSQRQNRWTAVAEAVNARMRVLGMHQQVDLVRASGVSDATVRVFMSGKLRDGKPPSDAKRAQICDALGWSPDSIDRLLAGNEPVEVKPGGGGARQSDFEVLAVRVARLQREVAALVAVSEDRVAKFDALLADTLPDLLARVRRLEDPGDSQASSAGH